MENSKEIMQKINDLVTQAINGGGKGLPVGTLTVTSKDEHIWENELIEIELRVGRFPWNNDGNISENADQLFKISITKVQPYQDSN